MHDSQAADIESCLWRAPLICWILFAQDMAASFPLLDVAFMAASHVGKAVALDLCKEGVTINGFALHS